MPKHQAVVFPGGTATFLRADNTFARASDPTPFIVTPMSRLSIGTELAALAVAAPASADWPATGRAIYIPFVLPESVTVVKLLYRHGSAGGSPTIDVGIYDSAYTRLISSGVTTQTGGDALQEFDVTDTAMGPGQFYFAIVGNTVATFPAVSFRWLAGGVPECKSLGLLQEASASPLPATATPVVVTTDYIPFVGLSLRTLVV